MYIKICGTYGLVLGISSMYTYSVVYAYLSVHDGINRSPRFDQLLSYFPSN